MNTPGRLKGDARTLGFTEKRLKALEDIAAAETNGIEYELSCRKYTKSTLSWLYYQRLVTLWIETDGSKMIKITEKGKTAMAEGISKPYRSVYITRKNP